MSREPSAGGPGLRHFGAANNDDQLPEMLSRPSYSAQRHDALGRTQPASMRGSEVDSKSRSCLVRREIKLIV
jgi:hypothetical protein